MTDKSKQNFVNCSGKTDSHHITSNLINSCPEKQYRTLMLTQMQIYRNHIGAHLKLHPHVNGKEKSLSHFFNMFGSFFRYIYCGFACENRSKCKVWDNKFFNVRHVFDFDELYAFPYDYSIGVKVKNCPHGRELNAIQVFIAKTFMEWDQCKKDQYLDDMHKNNYKTNIRLFLNKYGHLIQEMFCSTVCSKRNICKCGNTYIPRHYA